MDQWHLLKQLFICEGHRGHSERSTASVLFMRRMGVALLFKPHRLQDKFFCLSFFFNVKIIHSFTQWSVVETSFISASKKEHLIISCITSRVEYVLYILQLCCSLTLQILHLLLKSGCKHSFCCKVSRAWTQTVYKRWLQPLLLCSLTVFWCPQLSFWPLQCSWTVNVTLYSTAQ